MHTSPTPPLDPASIFLGPKAENADVFEALLLEAFRDHVFWRRNFHPEDGFSVHDAERRAPGFERSVSVLREHLMELLGELKGGVPFFSPRYVGHMNADLTMASLIGYFATMLYNPNNVAAEASPVTTRMELEVGADLARMLGYPADRQWSHLTSGGTVANFEALWLARNVRYLPLALHWAAKALGRSVSVQRARGDNVDTQQLGLWDLLNVPPAAALDAMDRLVSQQEDPRRVLEVLSQCSLTGLGFQEFGRRVTSEFGDSLAAGVVLVPATAHYSFNKLCGALGMGSGQLVHVPVDSKFRMSTDALWKTLVRLEEQKQPVIACVSVIGSTEESAVDHLDQVVALRLRAQRELGMSFWLHADAAWGGYATALLRGSDGRRRTLDDVRSSCAPEDWPEAPVYQALCAIGDTDSVTIDPHKLGYVPYPSGAICFRDVRVRSLISAEAPYVFTNDARDVPDLGRFILEGSKPGAAAAAAWMSHRVVPLDADGHGRLVAESIRGARRLHRILDAQDWSPFRAVVMPRPDLNIVCVAFGHPGITSLEANNAFMERVHNALSSSGGKPARALDHVVSRTTLRAVEYGDAALPHVRALGFSDQDYHRAGGLTVLRCTVMNPMAWQPRGRVDVLSAFAQTLRTALADGLRAAAGTALPQKA